MPFPTDPTYRRVSGERGKQGGALHVVLIDCRLAINASLAERVMAECKSRGRDANELAADILEIVVRDDLFRAVLDT